VETPSHGGDTLFANTAAAYDALSDGLRKMLATLTGVNNATLSIKANFPVNGASAGTELVNQGSFIAPGIFAIPLQTPVSNLSTSHVTAVVADIQGNTNVVNVRFWVDAGFHILSLDASALNSQQLTVRFENPSGSTNHIVFGTDDVSKPMSA